MDLLKFITAGSVDDGKSTLIGRLLYDSHVLLEDQLHAITSKEDEKINLAYITDGLKAEREKGITIDVAYRYFTTAKRKFIVIDTPGHVQYTRNMVTGVSNAEVALILVDAKNGLVEQTYRHSYIALLFGIDTIIVCVNKMDLVEYDENVFEKIKNDYTAFAKSLRCKNICFIPISALKGDNVVNRSDKMNWYGESCLLELLENMELENYPLNQPARFAVQIIIETGTYQGFAGTVWNGELKVGDEVVVLPSKFKSKIISIDTMNGSVQSAKTMQSVSICLKDSLEVKRGDLLVSQDRLPKVVNELEVTCCWLNEKSMQLHENYLLRIGINECDCTVTEIVNRVNIQTMTNELSEGLLTEVDDEVSMNDIVRIKIKTSQPIAFDNYYESRYTGSMILIEKETNETVAAAIVF